MKNSEMHNPLLGIAIGNTVFSNSGKFNSSVVSKPISIMVAQEESHKSMSGQSSYVYSDEMNQGSFGMSGSYGTTGISKIKSSLSAYVGKSSAVSSKSVSVNYNAISIGGIEYINFEALTASDFLASLNLRCMQSSTAVLDIYNEIMAKTTKFGVDLMYALSSTDSKFDEVKKLVNKWITVSEKFTQEFGDGLVVGVTWGAYGGVNMNMEDESKASSWKYGGAADFSYANLMSSVAVKSTYDGGQSNGYAGVTVRCSSFVSGSVLAPQIDKWLDQVTNKSFNELADVKVMDKAPDMKITQGAPAIPDFEKPKPSKDISNKVGEIKDLNGLATLAKAQAYDDAKKKNSELTLEQFLIDSEKPANTNELKNFRKNVSENQIDTLPLDNFSNDSDNIAISKESNVTHLSRIAQPSANGKENAGVSPGYVPLGLWISNWADIFPWMAQGYYNSIDKIENEQAVRERVMLQDYQTLSMLYYLANSSGITEFKRKDASLPRVSSLDIAKAFANAAGRMQENQGKTEKIKEIFEELGSDSIKIYTLWNEIAFLRDCELGMGLIKDKKSIGVPLTGDSERQTYSLTSCTFEGRNHTAFSSFFKVLPLITPDGEIWAFGPEKGGLSAAYPTEIVFSKPGRAKYIPFTYNQEQKILINSDYHINLYPIPFSAANNVEWKGMSLSTNIGSINSFKNSLKSLNDDLDKLKAWSFSSANWDENWKGTDAYSQRKIKKQYIGLIDEIKNIL